MFHSRGPEVRRPAGEFGWGGDTRRLLLVSQPSCRAAVRLPGREGARRCAGSGQTCRSRCPLGRPRPSRRPLASPASAERPAAATSQCGRPAAAKLLTRRRDESRRSRFPRTHLLAGTKVSRATGRFTPRRPAVSLRARTALLPEEQSQRPGRSVLSLRKECEARAAMCGAPPFPEVAAGPCRSGRKERETWFGVVVSSTRLPRYDNIGKPNFKVAVETKMRAFCPLAWSGLPAAFVWLPDGQQQLHFSYSERSCLAKRRDLQGGFV